MHRRRQFRMRQTFTRKGSIPALALVSGTLSSRCSHARKQRCSARQFRIASTASIVLAIAAIVLATAAQALGGGPAVGGLWAATSADMAVAAQQAGPTAQACTIRDGTASTGARVGRAPIRYEYGNSPYVGVRYDSCADVVKVYFGGYTGITHYNLRYTESDRVPLRGGTWFQMELGPGTARVFTMTARSSEPHWNTYSVQACRRGGLFERSSCTRWSPTVAVRIG